MALRESGSRMSKRNSFRANLRIGRSHGSSCLRIGRKIIMHLTKRNLESTKSKDSNTSMQSSNAIPKEQRTKSTENAMATNSKIRTFPST